MKFVIESPKTSVANFFRRAGYVFQKQNDGEMAFVRKLTDQPFPRFHLFVRIVDYKFQVNFHIDHKATSYDGTSAHSGEYDKDNELLKAEAGRLMSL
ncbi:MAG: hypothetical protein PHF35_02555 [Candidatus Moranbacteria bacterium]|nr:hypothetical protein [Candidatus Moranbacteria bacterium]